MVPFGATCGASVVLRRHRFQPVRMSILLTKVQPFAKAVVPFVLTIIAVAAQWISTGSWDSAEFATALTGLLAAVVTYFVPNKPAA